MAQSETTPLNAWRAALRPDLLEPTLRTDLIRQLYSFQPLVTLSSAALLVGVGTFVMMRTADPVAAVFCTAAMLGILSLVPIERAYRRRPTADPADADRWAARYGWASCVYALALGCLATRTLSISDDPLIAVLMAAFCLAGAATAIRNFTWPRILFGQLVALIVMPALCISIERGGLYWILAPAGVVLALNLAQVGDGLFRAAVAALINDAALKAEAIRANRSEQRFRLAMKATRDWIWEWDLEADVITRADPHHVARAFDLSDGPRTLDSWRDLVHPDDAAAAASSLVRAIKGTATTWTAQYRYRRRDGSYAHMLDRGMIVRDETGQAVQMIGAAGDISDLVEVGAALRESEEHYRNRIELDPHHAWTADAAGMIIEMSPRWAEATGLSVDDALGDGWLRAVHPDDRNTTGQAFTTAGQDGRSVELQIRFRMADGSYRWFRLRAYPRRNELGEILRWYGYSEDVHEEMLAQEELAASRARFRTVFDQALVGIAISVPDKGIVMANERFAVIMGRSPADLVGLTAADLTYGEDLEWSLASFREHAATGRPFIVEKRYMRPDGSPIWCRTNIAFVNDSEASQLAIIVVEDVSERKLAEARAEELQSELVRVSRATAMGALGTAIAHEINQPLAAITNYVAAARMFLNRMEDLPRGPREALDAASSEALRAGEVIKRLRNFAGRARSETGPNDLAALVREAIAIAFVGTQDTISSKLDLRPGVMVLVDRIQIEQVLINLFRNAVDAMHDRPRRELHIHTAVVDGTARIDVCDTGSGLPNEIREHLFAPYRTTKDGGMGIGLSICHKIIEAHGGRIWAEDRPEGGTRFSFTLPLAVEEADAA